MMNVANETFNLMIVKKEVEFPRQLREISKENFNGEKSVCVCAAIE